MTRLLLVFGLVLQGVVSGLVLPNVANAQNDVPSPNLFELVDRKIRYIEAGTGAGLLSELYLVDHGEILDHGTQYAYADSDLLLFVVHDDSELPALKAKFEGLSPVFDLVVEGLGKQVSYYDLTVTNDGKQRAMRVYFVDLSKLTKTEYSADCISRFVYATAIFENNARMLDHIGCK